MKLHDINSPLKRKKAQRVGRGMAAGRGKTAGRGTKGQKARGGFDLPRRFEGGQTPLIQRLPKTGGFTPRSTIYTTVRVDKINSLFKKGDRVSPKTLFVKGLIPHVATKVKIIGPGKLNHFVRLERIILTKRLAGSLPTPQHRPARNAAKKSKVSIKSTVRRKKK